MQRRARKQPSTSGQRSMSMSPQLRSQSPPYHQYLDCNANVCYARLAPLYVPTPRPTQLRLLLRSLPAPSLLDQPASKPHISFEPTLDKGELATATAEKLPEPRPSIGQAARKEHNWKRRPEACGKDQGDPKEIGTGGWVTGERITTPYCGSQRS